MMQAKLDMSKSEQTQIKSIISDQLDLLGHLIEGNIGIDNELLRLDRAIAVDLNPC
jgi:hypothetical protein